uniref:G-protein coupled receptors family 1 profile domain-containing protein n=1 Tax=Cavia porcellus TaxID=10141 RepID=A0A286Y0G0_CAVPO
MTPSPGAQTTMSGDLTPPAAVQLCYENVNRSCVKAPYSPGPRLLLYLVFGSGAVLAVLGNLLVITSILHFKQLHSPANFLIASLACADFMVGTTVMPFSMVRSVESCWYFGDSFCKLHSCFDGSFCYSSIFHLCFISIDRYIAVTDTLVYPTRFTASVSGMCITFWLLAVVFTFSLLYTGANVAGLEELVSALTCVGGCQIAVNQNWAAKPSDSYKDRVARRERKATTILDIAVIAFLISWLPYFIDSLIDAFLGFITPTYVYEILVWIVYYNSAMNPLIYALFYPWFRKAIKLIITGKVFRENSSIIKLFSE